MKRLFFGLLFTAVLAVFVAAWMYSVAKPASDDKNFRSFVIEKGTSASGVGDKLEKAGLIKNSLAFKLYLQFTGQSGKLQAGEFRLSPSMSLFQIVESLFKGPVELWVTIPEGLRREEIAAKFASGLDRDQVFIDEFLLASKGSEGALLPDTYLFQKDASASAIVAKMIKTFKSKTADLGGNEELTNDQRIVLASLIERETKTAAERPIVAGIIIKRFKAGWPLQIDASVQYAVGTAKNWWQILTLEDLKIDSRYNSYKFSGLPPTPIANPGMSSISAAFAPEASDYWYYIHDSDGRIHYAETLDGHNSNIRKYLSR